MSERNGSAIWYGRGEDGRGKVSTETGTLKGADYSFSSRFEEDKRGTNPEELIAAAHAACFAMAFSFACDKAGFVTEAIDTTASVRIVLKEGGFVIDRISLEMSATVPGIDEATFQALAQGAKVGCPVSRALGGVPDLVLKATLRR